MQFNLIIQALAISLDESELFVQVCFIFVCLYFLFNYFKIRETLCLIFCFLEKLQLRI